MTNIRAIAAETRLSGIGGLWYLATPYARYPFGTDAAARGAARIAVELIRLGVDVFSPIAHGHALHQLEPGDVEAIPHDRWMQLDEYVMAACQGCIVARMPGYHFSEGVTAEVDWFTKAGLPVLYVDVIELLGLPPIFNDHTLAHEAAAKLMGEPQPDASSVQPSSLNPPGTSTDQAQRLFGGYGPTEKEVMDKLERNSFAAMYGGMNPQIIGVDPAIGDTTVCWVLEKDGTRRPATVEEIKRCFPADMDAYQAAQESEANPPAWARVPQPQGGPTPEVERSNADINRQTRLKSFDPRNDHDYRKARPITTGVLDYFPLALAEIALVSQKGHEQHGYGGPLFWERTWSNDHADAALRHLSERGTNGPNNARHTAQAAWRILALLQEEMEEELMHDWSLRPEVVFSPASRWHGDTSMKYFGEVLPTYPAPGEPYQPWGRDYWLSAAFAYYSRTDHVAKPNPQDPDDALRRAYPKIDTELTAILRPGGPMELPGGMGWNKDSPEFQAGYVAGLHDGQNESAGPFKGEPQFAEDGTPLRAAAWKQAAEKLRNDVAKAVEPEPTDTAESVQDHAARSLYEMIVEWYAISTSSHISLDNIKRRLKRFWHD